MILHIESPDAERCLYLTEHACCELKSILKRVVSFKVKHSSFRDNNVLLRKISTKLRRKFCNLSLIAKVVSYFAIGLK